MDKPKPGLIRQILPWFIVLALICYIFLDKIIESSKNLSFSPIHNATDRPNRPRFGVGFTTPPFLADFNPTTLPSEEAEKCEIQKNVVFLKTHKTGSETMSGIIRRFAAMQNLSAGNLSKNLTREFPS